MFQQIKIFHPTNAAALQAGITADDLLAKVADKITILSGVGL